MERRETELEIRGMVLKGNHLCVGYQDGIVSWRGAWYTIPNNTNVMSFAVIPAHYRTVFIFSYSFYGMTRIPKQNVGMLFARAKSSHVPTLMGGFIGKATM